MFVNERKIPIKIRQLGALLNRIPKNHKMAPKLERELAIRKAGYRGEQNLDYHLSFLSKDYPYTIIRDIRLEAEYAFQIDTFLISPYYSLIIDAKNYSGSLYINPHTDQLIRINDQNEEEGFQNPIFQVQRQQKQLKDWLLKQKFDPFPIEYLVAFHEGNSIFKTNLMDKRLFNRIIFAENILHKMKRFEGAYKAEKLDEKKIRKLKKVILQQNIPADYPILKEYEISLSELKRGVQCPKCQHFGMKRISGSWKCPSCQTTSKTAHNQAIEDFILINGFITNRQCEIFLMVTSSDIAYRLLKDLPLSYSGKNKARQYYL